VARLIELRASIVVIERLRILGLTPDALASRCVLVIDTYNLFTWSKQKWLFWRAGFYLANLSNLKSFQKTLIGWKKASFSNSHFSFDHVNRRLLTLFPIFGPSSLPVVVAQPDERHANKTESRSHIGVKFFPYRLVRYREKLSTI